MNRATLQTYVRAALSTKPQTIEEITYKVQKQLPNDKDITVGRVKIILTQLNYHGLVKEENYSTNTEYFSSI